jgi:hypothetical protein
MIKKNTQSHNRVQLKKKQRKKERYPVKPVINQG